VTMTSMSWSGNLGPGASTQAGWLYFQASLPTGVQPFTPANLTCTSTS
jgi:hypothetical protein